MKGGKGGKGRQHTSKGPPKNAAKTAAKNAVKKNAPAAGPKRGGVKREWGAMSRDDLDVPSP